MRQSRVASRYASALYEQAHLEKNIDTVIADVRGLKAMIAESRDLALFFQSPVIKSEQKAITVKKLFEKSDISLLLRNFVLLLVKKGRENDIQQIIEAFEGIYNAQNGFVPVHVTSAFAMDSQQQEKLLKKIEATTGKKPIATYTVNNSLIGGFTVQIGDSITDGSIRHQLDVLKIRLNEGTMSN